MLCGAQNIVKVFSLNYRYFHLEKIYQKWFKSCKWKSNFSYFTQNFRKIFLPSLRGGVGSKQFYDLFWKYWLYCYKQTFSFFTFYLFYINISVGLLTGLIGLCCVELYYIPPTAWVTLGVLLGTGLLVALFNLYFQVRFLEIKHTPQFFFQCQCPPPPHYFSDELLFTRFLVVKWINNTF